MKKPLILLTLLLAYPAESSQESVRLRVGAKVGDVFRYRVETNDTAISMSMKVMTVKSGKFEIHSRIEGMSIAGSSAPEVVAKELRKMLIVTMMDGRGKTLRQEVRGASPEVESAMTGGSSVPFPEQALRVGDTWRAQTKTSGVTLNAVHRLASLETVANRRAAVIRTTITGLPDGMQYDEMVSVVEIETGFPISMSVTGSVTSPEAIHSFNMRMARIWPKR